MIEPTFVPNWGERVARHTKELADAVSRLAQARDSYKEVRAYYKRVENDLRHAQHMHAEQMAAEVRRLREMIDRPHEFKRSVKAIQLDIDTVDEHCNQMLRKLREVHRGQHAGRGTFEGAVVRTRNAILTVHKYLESILEGL